MDGDQPMFVCLQYPSVEMIPTRTSWLYVQEEKMSGAMEFGFVWKGLSVTCMHLKHDTIENVCVIFFFFFFSGRPRSGQQHEESKSSLTTGTTLTETLSQDKSQLWNSVAVDDAYKRYGGKTLSRHQVVQAISDHLHDEIIVFSFPGYAHIIAFQTQATKIMKVVRDKTDEEDLKSSINKVEKKTAEECKALNMDKTNYLLKVDNNTSQEAASTPMMDLLAQIIPRLIYSAPALLIANTATGSVRCHLSGLQFALGILFRDSKQQLG